MRKIPGTTVAISGLILTALTAIVGFSAAQGSAVERLQQQERRIDRLEQSISNQLISVQTDVREIRQFLLGDRQRYFVGGASYEGERN